jgi:hypothetical protein
LQFIIEGSNEKVCQFILLLMSIFNKNCCFNEQTAIFKHYVKSETINNIYNYIILVLKNDSTYLFRPVACTINIVTIIKYATRGVVY